MCSFMVELAEIGEILMLGEGTDLWYTDWQGQAVGFSLP
jgi:hypothetical protein